MATVTSAWGLKDQQGIDSLQLVDVDDKVFSFKEAKDAYRDLE